MQLNLQQEKPGEDTISPNLTYRYVHYKVYI